MFKHIFGLAPILESDGSYSPSKMALKMAVTLTLFLLVLLSRN